MPNSFAFTAVGSGLSTVPSALVRGVKLGLGIPVNSIAKDLVASGGFNIGEDVRWTSFAKTFDVQD